MRRLLFEIDHFLQYFLDDLHVRRFRNDLIHLIAPSFLDKSLFSVPSTRDDLWLWDIMVLVESAD